MIIIYVPLVLVGLVLAALLKLRLGDWRADMKECARLSGFQPKNPANYDPKMVADLPELAQRYFNYMIAPDTPLLPVVELNMGGYFSLEFHGEPNYQTMRAQQILAAPHGFVWRMRLLGKMLISGSDAGSWTRFRILGLIPVARLGENSDHARFAYGRHIAESVFWAPSAVLPGPGVVWESVDSDTARVIVSYEMFSQGVDFTVDAEGKQIAVSFMRWSNANQEKKYRLQPFGGSLSDFRQIQGYRLPFKIDAGNMYGTENYFAFFKAEVTSIRFPGYSDY